MTSDPLDFLHFHLPAQPFSELEKGSGSSRQAGIALAAHIQRKFRLMRIHISTSVTSNEARVFNPSGTGALAGKS